ncbi:MAG: DNA mismatch repair endonuclease MutL [Oscillospiraceae bacterium]
MSVIHILSPHVADLIAAGEVVERPASVVKELVENAIDAGARNITVEIENGGMKSIRVTDDGCGMSPEDAGVAFLRHATSKLRDERGLEAIATLGFRGEALAAISSVSRVELLTREKGAATGTRVALTAGDIDEMGPVGCPQGTVMTVRDLFYNTPARLKFIKSDRAESGACVNTALRCALGHPEVSVRMIRDGQEEFFSPGDGQAKSCVYSLLGRDNAMNMLACRNEADGVAVSGFVSAPHAGRGNRALQFFFLNGRSFRSAALQAALEQAYKNTLLTGRFPACVLYISLDFSRVDVNVHPTKSEVKFSEEKKVFDAVYYAVLSALQERDQVSTAQITLSPGTQKAVQPRADFFQTMTSTQFRASVPAGDKPRSPAYTPVQTSIRLSDSRVSPPLSKGGWPGEAGPGGISPAGAAHVSLRQEGPGYAPSPAVPRPEIPRAETPAPQPEEAPSIAEPDFRVIGEALDTYILVEKGEELILIDKHAAHERLNFDRLSAAGGTPMSQTLLVPVTLSPGQAAVETLEQNAPLLEQAGFEIEPYGAGSVIVRAVPADSDGDVAAMLEEILENLSHGDANTRRDAVLKTIACKAAIKAGKRSDSRELRLLAEKVLSGQVRYCPHGRPVSVVLTRKELDKFFKRIV